MPNIAIIQALDALSCSLNKLVLTLEAGEAIDLSDTIAVFNNLTRKITPDGETTITSVTPIYAEHNTTTIVPVSLAAIPELESKVTIISFGDKLLTIDTKDFGSYSSTSLFQVLVYISSLRSPTGETDNRFAVLQAAIINHLAKGNTA
jgi:hypothetical protein